MIATLVRTLRHALLAVALFGGLTAQAADPKQTDTYLGPGDVIRISVFQNPDLTLETRVSDAGAISYPLIGTVAVGGKTAADAEKTIAKLLKDGGFVVQPQVSVLLIQVRGNQVSVLGQVNRPGRYPLETANTRLSDMLAQAGGVAGSGADIIHFTGVRNGKTVRREIDVAQMFLGGSLEDDMPLAGGDILYVHRAPVFYIYGEVQRPGAFRVERGMTVMQALATGGGLTAKGTLRGLRLHRRGADGKVQVLEPVLDDQLRADDVVYVKESIF